MSAEIKRKQYVCTENGCKATFSNNRKLTNHIRKHKGERPFACDVEGCDKTYTNSSHLRRHKNVFHEKKFEMVVCTAENCNKVFSNKSNLKKHVNRMHNRNEPYAFVCKHCNQGFDKKRQLQQHTYLHTGEAAFGCDKCEKKFVTLTECNKHRRNHKTYVCECNEVFHLWSLLLQHKKTCKELRPKCAICQKEFKNKQNLKYHMNVHQLLDNKNVFVCTYKNCDRYYFYKKNLVHHINVFHRKRIKKLPCMHLGCEQMFTKMQNLKQHMAVVHMAKPRVKKARKPRKDKGTLKKDLAAEMAGLNEHVLKENFESNVCEQNGKNVESDDPLLKQCDIILDVLQKRIDAIK